MDKRGVKMTAYVISKEKFKVYSKHKSHWDVNMSEDFGPEAINYRLLKSEDEAYNYWHEHVEDTGIFYEGLGVSEDIKHEMFEGWINE